jgi:DNA-binding NarL/FixJ family response regulator
MTTTFPTRLRILIADDHPGVLAGVRMLLNSDPRMEIIGEAQDGETALRMAMELYPDVLVLDLSMPELNGAEVARRLHAQLPSCKVVVLTAHEDHSYLRKMIEVGAVGYVLKRSAANDLLRAIHAVASGGLYLDPLVAALAVDRTRRKAAAKADLAEREVEVLRLISMGHSNRAVAGILKIGVGTVETIKARAMDKLGLENRVDLAGYADERGWLTDGDEKRAD